VAASTITLPGTSNRTLIIGRTGSGKSYFGVWLLSMQNFDVMPWVIIDFKDEDSDIINQIDGLQYLSLYDALPKRPGIYIIKPTSGEIKDGSLAAWFQAVFDSGGGIGLYIDEVFPIGQYNEPFNTILMQGRSKFIPVIACTQRPTNISVYCFSEASYIFVFDLTKKNDRKTIASELPIDSNYDLPEYHSYYFNVSKKHLAKLGPAPDGSEVLLDIAAKMPKQKRTL
jgi:hypothetical protein